MGLSIERELEKIKQIDGDQRPPKYAHRHPKLDHLVSPKNAADHSPLRPADKGRVRPPVLLRPLENRRESVLHRLAQYAPGRGATPRADGKRRRMKKAATKPARRNFLLAAGAGLAAVAMPQVSRAQTLNWRIQSAWPQRD